MRISHFFASSDPGGFGLALSLTIEPWNIALVGMCIGMLSLATVFELPAYYILVSFGKPTSQPFRILLALPRIIVLGAYTVLTRP